MSLGTKYNLKSPGVKRLMREAMELANPTEEYYACPLDDNLFEWHFTVRGPSGTEFEGGCYHGRILLPSQYPMQPPNIILLTPNGRFEVNKKICLSISGHHPESWQPSWSIRTAMLALIAFMPTTAAGTIGSLDYSADERRLLARKSEQWECPTCGGRPAERLAPSGEGAAAIPELTQEESCLLRKIALKAEEDTNRKEPKVGEEKDNSSPQVNEERPEIRQRVIPSTNDDESNLNTADSLLQASMNSSHRDKMWAVVMWLLLSIIILLLIRRLFFL